MLLLILVYLHEQAFKEGAVRFLICTDVAARGIDVRNLPYVISTCGAVGGWASHARVYVRCHVLLIFYTLTRTLTMHITDYTLPAEESDYIHRIGRVGRADAMGLALSIVSTVPEKVVFVDAHESSELDVCMCVMFSRY